MTGLLIYKEDDAKINADYIDWIITSALKLGMDLELLYSHDFFERGLRKKYNKVEFAINRSRSYNLSLILELADIKVFNNSQVTLLGNNKLAAYRYAKLRGYKYAGVLASWEDEKELITKPIGGHGGKGIEVLKPNYPSFNEGSFQQEFLSDIIGDIRFYIINNRIIHSVIRKAKAGYLSNYSRGGAIEYYRYSIEEETFVNNFINDLQIDYAGIDFLLLKNNELIFNEIEDVVGSRMLSSLGLNNTTELFLEHILSLR